MSVSPSQDPAAPAPGTITDPHHLLPAHATDETTVVRRKPWRMWVILLLVLLVIGIIVWRLHASKAADQQEAQKSAAAANRPVPVQTYAVQQRTVPVFLSALGTVTAYNTVTLHSRVDGQLLAVNFTEGQNVRKGQLLLEIDPRPYQATVDQAVGTLAKDEANLKNTQAEADRYTALYQAGVVSKEQQQTQVSNAGQAAGSIKADQAAIEAAKVNLGYTRIYSPIDGVVGLRQVDPGNIVHASDSTGLIVITQVHPIAVVFTLPEDQLPLVQQAMRGGNKLVVEAYDRSDAHKIAAGTLLTIDNQIDTTTGTAKLKAVFQNEDNALFSNQFVNIRLILRERQNATVVPTAAIGSGTDGDFVFVVNPGPTPANKRKNLPNTSNSAGGKNAGHNAGNSTAGNSSAAPAGAPEGGNGDNSDNSGGEGSRQQRKPYHADRVPVHVDFVIGTMSVLSDNELKPNDQVVVDGQEKLVDGSNVQPQAARNQTPPQASGSVGVGSSSNNGGGLMPGANSAVPPDGATTSNTGGPGSTVGSAPGDTSNGKGNGSANGTGHSGGHGRGGNNGGGGGGSNQ